MATDLAHEPSAGIPVQACGDCHLMNFGAFNSPEDNILFDVNDFDETLPGVDFTVDVKRLAASVAVAARAANMSNKRARASRRRRSRPIANTCRALMELSPLEIWHSRIDLEQEIKHIESPELRRSLSTVIRQRAGIAVSKRTTTFRIWSRAANRGSPTSRRRSSISAEKPSGPKLDVARGFATYRERSRPIGVLSRPLSNAGHRLQGGGRRIGRHVLLRWAVHERDNEPLFLQLKEAQRSVLERLGAIAYQVRRADVSSKGNG